MLNGVQTTPVRFAASSKKEASEGTRLITVTGNGKVEKDPDTMTISLSRSEQNKDKKTVFKALTDFGKKVVDALKSLKLPVQIETSRSGPYLNKEWKNNKYVTDGYKGEFRVVVTEKGSKPADLSSHAAQIDEVAYENGAEFNGPHYGLSNQESAEVDADKKAIRNALETAKNYAAELGFTIDEVPVSVSDKADGSGGYYPKAVGMRAMAASADSAGGGYQSSADAYQAKPIEVNANPVTVQFKINGKSKK